MLDRAPDSPAWAILQECLPVRKPSLQQRGFDRDLFTCAEHIRGWGQHSDLGRALPRHRGPSLSQSGSRRT